ncbi:MAG TPA: VWA domain-containing protein, partial [Bryobacterales bacterium]|nr:VWA domain-containing protein [Bryobacterales bacterium]
MALLNLTLGQFLAVLLPVCAAVVALYLYDRSHRRQIVSTLRFFRQVSQAPVFTRRKKIRQPWSLLLQLISLALLLLAIAELELGHRARRSSDHVLILETSAWMNSSAPAAAASGSGRTTLLQLAERRALEYLRAAPPQDRVMLVRADQLATPITPFTSDRRQLEAAIRASRAGSTALNLPAALAYARSSQRLASEHPGEIVIIGSGRMPRADLEKAAAADMFGVRAILAGGEPNNCGLRKLAARRMAADPSLWEIEVGAHNYGAAERRLPLTLAFGGARIASKTLALGPEAGAEARFQFRAKDAGTLEAFLDSRDDYRADNHAAIELPKLTPLKIQVFTAKPGLWRPLLTASLFLDPEFHRPAEYTASGPAGRLVILDGFNPPAPPRADAVWIAPAPAAAQAKIHVRRWNPAHPITAGLHNRDLQVNKTAILEAPSPEAAVAESDDGPVLVASQSGGFKKIVFGFHPLEEGAENHLVIPLLFANLVRWVSPDLFRASEVTAGPPGVIEADAPAGTRPEQVHVRSAQGRELPFTLVADRLRFFAGQAGTVHVTMPERELVYALNLPEVGDARWTPPPGTKRGVPPASGATPLGR